MNKQCTRRFACGIASFLLALQLAPAHAAPVADVIFGGDFSSTHNIQWTRRHPRAGGASIWLAPAFVTALRLSGTSLTLYLQIPPALKGGGSDYPVQSALKTFRPTSGAVPAIGDCVIAVGTIALFNGATELTDAMWYPSADGCGATPITPTVPGFVESIATDTDSVTDGLQPGLSAEAFESVLVRLNSVDILTSNGGMGAFQIGDAVSGPAAYLNVGGFLYQYTSVQGTTLTSITGVLDEFDSNMQRTYQLLPRSAADIVP